MPAGNGAVYPENGFGDLWHRLVAECRSGADIPAPLSDKRSLQFRLNFCSSLSIQLKSLIIEFDSNYQAGSGDRLQCSVPVRHGLTPEGYCDEKTFSIRVVAGFAGNLG